MKTRISLTPALPRFRFFPRRCGVLLLAMSISVVPRLAIAQSAGLAFDAALPDAPEPQTPASSTVPEPQPCAPMRSPETLPVKPSVPEARNKAGAEAASGDSTSASLAPCMISNKNWYQRFALGPRDTSLTPTDKGWLAARNLIDPFNVITILGEAGISVASNPESPYGPGMPGYGRYVGVSFTQDMTGEFFGTFLIPSLAHQDPHYHRMEHASISRRIVHACLQILWTQADNGRGMPNYANIFGFAVDEEISNLYVPGRATNAPASAERYGTVFATAPIGNFVSEFLPDVASHLHVQVVVIQRIINQVAKTNGASL